MGEGGLNNFVGFALMNRKFSSVPELDVLYAMVTKVFVTPSLLRNYNVITVHETHRPKI